MADAQQQTWWQSYRPLITWMAVTLTLTLAGAIGGWQMKPVPPPVFVEVEKPASPARNAPPQPDEFGMGWVRDEEQIEANRDAAKTLQFATTPAGKAILGDVDVFLYRATRKAAGKAAPWYPNVNQRDVGCCVGCGFKHGFDVVQATAIAAGQRFEWKPASVEVIYSISRVDVGRGQIRGDGSMGAWAAEGAKQGAIAPMERIGSTDLSTFDPQRARAWGRTGVPAEVKTVAKQHPVKATALVTSSIDVKRALQQGYPVCVCSTIGFNNRDGSVGTRDAQGFCTARGTWPHCMLFLAWRNGDRPGALCLNSWGDNAHGGPVWPEDMPLAAFWVDEATVDRMVRQGDSFALSDVVGFPSRKVIPDWFVWVPAMPRVLDLEYALAP
jgi:hypothetical protein